MKDSRDLKEISEINALIAVIYFKIAVITYNFKNYT